MKSVLTTTNTQKIAELQHRLDTEDLSKNARKTLRKKIRKFEEQIEEESKLNQSEIPKKEKKEKKKK